VESRGDDKKKGVVVEKQPTKLFVGSGSPWESRRTDVRKSGWRLGPRVGENCRSILSKTTEEHEGRQVRYLGVGKQT